MRVTTADDIARMMGKFRSNVEYSDAPNGFFGYVRETFAQLAKEEEHAADWEGVTMPDYPSFGHKDDTYEDVVREFYAVWNGFATKKTFAWKDKYRLSDAPDRRVRRLMEKENKRFREEGVREFNEAVRALLLFVRKRDPRYTPNTQSADERAAEQRKNTKEQAARARAARAAQMDQAVPEWATRRDADDEQEEEEEEIEEEHYECVACHKTFKSERQYEAHEKSKKHQKAVQALRRKMQKDNAQLNLDEDIMNSGAITPVDDELSGDGEDPNGADASAKDITNVIENLSIKDETRSKDEQDEETEEAKTKSAQSASSDTPSDSEDEYASRSDIEARLAGFRTSTSATSPSPLNPESPALDPDASAIPAAPKLGKAAQKRAKKAAKQTDINDSELKHKCVTCNSAFPSKTQLFQHIKDFKHAAPVSVTKGAAGGGGAKKKGKRK